MSEFFNELQGSELEGYQNTQARMKEGSVLSALMLIKDVKSARLPYYMIQEALQPRTPGVVQMLARNYPGLINMRESMTTSDFPNLLSSVMGRIMLARFAAWPATWKAFVNIGPDRRDFRPGQYIGFDGLEGAFIEVGESTELPYGSMNETPYAYSIKKYAKGARLSWELIINDDLGAFDTIPDRLARGAARTIARAVTSLYVGATGPNTTFFSAGNGNLLAGNPPLSIASLQAAYAVLRSRVDADGEPIMVESSVLVTPSGNLEIVAKNILNSTQILPVSTAGGAVVNNWVSSGITAVADPYAGVIPTSNAATSWYLFAAPGVAAQSAIELSYLSGFATPQLFKKASNTARIGGGVAEEMGDWNHMATEYKAVICFGSSLISPKSAVASNGSGV